MIQVSLYDYVKRLVYKRTMMQKLDDIFIIKSKAAAPRTREPQMVSIRFAECAPPAPSKWPERVKTGAGNATRATRDATTPTAPKPRITRAYEQIVWRKRVERRASGCGPSWVPEPRVDKRRRARLRNRALGSTARLLGSWTWPCPDGRRRRSPGSAARLAICGLGGRPGL